MTTFSLKKLLNCLVRDSKNHPDLMEMFREALKSEYDKKKNASIDFISDNIEINGHEWKYWFIADVWALTKNCRIEQRWSSEEISEILI